MKVDRDNLLKERKVQKYSEKVRNMKIKGFPFYFVNQADLTELKQLEEKVEDPQL